MKNCKGLEIIEVHEKEYLNRLQKSLNELPANTWILLCLCRKIGNFSDPPETTPLFAFKSDSVPENAIMEWATAISEENYLLPSLKVKYIMVTMSEEELELNLKLLQNEDGCEIEPPELRTVLLRYKEAVEMT